MFKKFRDKIAISGFGVLGLGVGLLIFTFLSAYGFLTQSLSIAATNDLATTFGESLAPLIATSIRLMYLGVMGWIGSLVTIRGVTIITHAPAAETVPQQLQEETNPLKRSENERKEKTAEPEIVVIPPSEQAQNIVPPKVSEHKEK